MAINEPAAGTKSNVTRVILNEKIIFCLRVTLFDSGITITRSFGVVSARMVGGWMIGTKAMYK